MSAIFWASSLPYQSAPILPAQMSDHFKSDAFCALTPVRIPPRRIKISNTCFICLIRLVFSLFDFAKVRIYFVFSKFKVKKERVKCNDALFDIEMIARLLLNHLLSLHENNTLVVVVNLLTVQRPSAIACFVVQNAIDSCGC